MLIPYNLSVPTYLSGTIPSPTFSGRAGSYPTPESGTPGVTNRIGERVFGTQTYLARFGNGFWIPKHVQVHRPWFLPRVRVHILDILCSGRFKPRHCRRALHVSESASRPYSSLSCSISLSSRPPAYGSC